jgi:hypothetical protein
MEIHYRRRPNPSTTSLPTGLMWIDYYALVKNPGMASLPHAKPAEDAVQNVFRIDRTDDLAEFRQ